jgi:hypothetical protein
MTEFSSPVIGEESLARCVLFPKNIADSENLAHQVLFDFGTLASNTRAPHGSSTGSISILKTKDAIHAFGCRMAGLSNQRKMVRPRYKDNVFDRVRDGDFYIGYYVLKSEDARAVITEIHFVDVEHCPENNENAHCHVLSKCREDLPDNYQDFKSKARSSRTKVIDRLYNILTGPERHVCEEDVHQREELTNVKLEALPASMQAPAASTPSTPATPDAARPHPSP